MLEIPLHDAQGKRTGGVEVDPEPLGGKVRPRLLKQAVVMYQANRRQNTCATRSRGMVVGSTRKLYRQKGTGNARAGARRTHVRRGGGVAFAKGRQVFTQSMNKKMRRLARNNAILAKIVGEDAIVIDDPGFDRPNTKRFVSLLRSLGVENGCLFAMSELNQAVYLSGRNIPKIDVRLLRDVSAYDVLLRRKLVMTKAAFDIMVEDPARLRAEMTAADE